MMVAGLSTDDASFTYDKSLIEKETQTLNVGPNFWSPMLDAPCCFGYGLH
jgi:hypothetical protein